MSELRELQELFWQGVVFGESTPVGYASRPHPNPCWFFANREAFDFDIGECEGRLEAAHWLKRQRVERLVEQMLWGVLVRDAGSEPLDFHWLANDLVPLAAWDPRNGVTACNHHHTRFDSQRMPPLVVVRRYVPDHVLEFVSDWGLEVALEDRNPLEA